MTPQQQAQQCLNRNCLILDSETTGLGEDDEIVEITIIDTAGKAAEHSGETIKAHPSRSDSDTWHH